MFGIITTPWCNNFFENITNTVNILWKGGVQQIVTEVTFSKLLSMLKISPLSFVSYIFSLLQY